MHNTAYVVCLLRSCAVLKRPKVLQAHEKLYVQRKQKVKVIWQKAPHGGPIPRFGVTPGGRKLYHW